MKKRIRRREEWQRGMYVVLLKSAGWAETGHLSGLKPGLMYVPN